MKSKQTGLYDLFAELCKRYSPEEVEAWGRREWPGLAVLAEAEGHCTAMDAVIEQHMSIAPPDGVGTGEVSEPQASSWSLRAEPEECPEGLGWTVDVGQPADCEGEEYDKAA